MQNLNLSRRQMLLGSGASLAGLALNGAVPTTSLAQAVQSSDAPTSDQARRMQWWHAAKFGMFIHFGVYSTIGRHEWVMEDEAIPVSRIRSPWRDVQSCEEFGARMGEAGEGRRYEVHGDDEQAS